MKTRYLFFAIIAFSFITADANGQSVERSRPAEWNNLVFGGRFMDRFLPSPVQGKLTSDCWGADNVIPRYTDNGIEDAEWSYWGGNALLGDNGKYHLFVCRWSERSERGHHEWPHSIVVHAVSDLPTGPYKVKDTVGPGHNPEIFQLKDGRYVVYVIDGYYIADSLNGPWQAGKFEFNPRDRKIIEGLSNLTFAQREDGSILMICRGGGVWISETGVSPYNQITDHRVYPAVEGHFEDPVVWRTNVQYHLIVNDWLGRIAYYLRSKDGVNWKTEPGEAYMPGISKYEDGTEVNWFKYERPKVLQDQYGRATQMDFAVIDVLKNDDKGGDNHSSKHICIPLMVGRLLTVLNPEPITSNTKAIRLKIEAEDGFDPQSEIDIDSLRLGSSDKVNYGEGCKAVRSEKSGADLIVIFDGADSGITHDDFAAKLLGKTKSGKLLFGFARLPGQTHIESILSARKPAVTKSNDGYRIDIEVQNFGQAASEPSKIQLIDLKTETESVIASGKVTALKPYQKTVVTLTGGDKIVSGSTHDLNVVISPSQGDPSTLTVKEFVFP
ncbi:glycoside hydrolase family protein [bacterium]|nr:glycoside hydrolase family protein [bacterium]